VALSNYGEAWKSILLAAPDCPQPLATTFVNNAARRIYDSARWSGQKQQSTFIIPIGITNAATSVTQASLTVTAVAGTWSSAVVGWQFFVDSQAPFYTVSGFSTGGGLDTLTLDRPYGETTDATAASSVQLIYLPVAADFSHFIDVIDVVNQWRLRLGPTVEDLDIWDPARTTSATPWLLAAIEPTSIGGRPRYEIYPRPDITTSHSYPYRYQRRLPELSAATDQPIYPVRAQTLREGALAELARWPGTQARPNPYFSLDLSAFHEKQFMEALQRDMREDQEINQTDIQYPALGMGGGLGWGAWPYAPISSSFMQSHLFYAWGWGW
jgi:hypothetical protein